MQTPASATHSTAQQQKELSEDSLNIEDSEDQCWICLQPASVEKGELKQHCKCKSLLAHDSCIAHWQLRKAGSVEELRCRLCNTQLPDWRQASLSKGKKALAKVVTLAVQVNGQTKYMKVTLGGQEKIAEFRKKITRSFGLSDTTHLDIDFTVEVSWSIQRQTNRLRKKVCVCVCV